MAGVASLKKRGGLVWYEGGFTHTAGTAEETLAVSSGYPVFVAIIHNSTSEKYDVQPIAFSHSVSGKVRTITFPVLSTVAAGRVVIGCLPG